MKQQDRKIRHENAREKRLVKQGAENFFKYCSPISHVVGECLMEKSQDV